MNFQQPVALSRLVPYDLVPLEQPLAQRSLRLELKRNDDEWVKASVVAQSATGWVRLRFDDDTEGLYALEREKYKWIN